MENPTNKELQTTLAILRKLSQPKIAEKWFTYSESLAIFKAAEAIESVLHYAQPKD